MNNIKKVFFSLIKGGLWGMKPDPSLFGSETDWEGIYKISKIQALLGIVLDGIELLPENYRPPRDLYLKWCAEVLQIEDNNLKLDIEVANLFVFLRENGVEPVLMKGQGVALNYPNPSHRSCGDIDIYIGKENYDKVNELLSIDGTSLDKYELKHMAYDWHDVIIENHRIMSNLLSPKSRKNHGKIIKSWHNSDNVSKVTISDTNITIPPIDYNAIYLLLHSVTHLMGQGIGLRQICDWCMFLHNNHKSLDKGIIKKYLEDVGLLNAWKVFGAMSVKYLGLKPEYLFFSYSDKDMKLGEFIINDILDKGNFGFEGLKKRKFQKYRFISLFYNYFNGIRRGGKLYYLAPQEALWLPVIRLSNMFKAIIATLPNRK